MYGVYADGAVYGAHVAVLDNWKQVSSSEAASKEGAPPIFKRAMFLGPAGVEVMVEIVGSSAALHVKVVIEHPLHIFIMTSHLTEAAHRTSTGTLYSQSSISLVG